MLVPEFYSANSGILSLRLCVGRRAYSQLVHPLVSPQGTDTPGEVRPVRGHSRPEVRRKTHTHTHTPKLKPGIWEMHTSPRKETMTKWSLLNIHSCIGEGNGNPLQ